MTAGTRSRSLKVCGENFHDPWHGLSAYKMQSHSRCLSFDAPLSEKSSPILSGYNRIFVDRTHELFTTGASLSRHVGQTIVMASAITIAAGNMQRM